MTLFEWFRDYNKIDNVNQIDDREVLCKLPSISLSNTAGELHTKANVEFAPHHCVYCFADKYGKVSDLLGKSFKSLEK